MKKFAACMLAVISAHQRDVASITMEDCISEIPPNSDSVCEYANTNGDVCWMRNDLISGDLIFQCETKQWTRLSCGSELVTTCPRYDEEGTCLFINCEGMVCKLTSPGRYGSKHLSCDKSTLDIETTTTTTPPITTTSTVSPDLSRRPNLADDNADCKTIIWGETKQSCKNSITSNNFGKCQYIIIPNNVVNNNELTICTYQCCGDENSSRCMTECETRVLYIDDEENRDMRRENMNNEEEENINPSQDNSQWGLSRGGEEFKKEEKTLIRGYDANTYTDVDLVISPPHASEARKYEKDN